jgi:serine/threonine protein kinase
MVNNKPNKSADVWAFGMVMNYVLLNKHPFYYIREEFKKKDDKEQNNIISM